MTGPSDEQRRQAGDPATSGQELADLAASFPELHDAILANPSAYDGLREWIHSYGPTLTPATDSIPSPFASAPKVGGRRGAVIAIAAGALVVVGGGATALAFTLGGLGASAPTSTSSPVAAASSAPSATPKPTPTPVTSAYLDEPTTWHVYGDSLYRETPDGVEFFTPGVGPTSFTYPDFDALEDSDDLSLRGGVTFTGPVNDLWFASLAFQRTPASGTTPESYALVSVAAQPGDEPVITELWPLTNPTYDSVTISTTSSGPAIGIAQTSGSSDDGEVAAGVNLETGQIIWRYDGGESDDDPMMDTMLVMVDQVEGFSITGCWDGYGVDIATGEVLFRTELEPCSYWSAGYQDYTLGADQGNDYRVYDRVTGAPLLGWRDQGAYNGGLRYDPIGHLGMTGDYDWSEELRVFDTGSGEVLYTMPYDQVKALYLSARTLWDGKIYATTTDAMIVLDARTGETLADDVDWYPLTGVGGWTLYSDGLFTSEDRPLAL